MANTRAGAGGATAAGAASGRGHGLTSAQVDTIRSILRPFADRIERVGIYGSRATGTWRPASDIDLILCGTIGDPDVDRIRTLLTESPLPIGADVMAYRSVEGTGLQSHIDRVMRILFTQAELIGDC
jgi:predicted nucleotidyltransferase